MYCALRKCLQEDGSNETIFGHCFLTLAWNLMCRSKKLLPLFSGSTGFPREKREKVKDKYHRPKLVQDCIATLVHAGLTAQVAIDRIHRVYGENTNVTNIINWMKLDRQAGVGTLFITKYGTVDCDLNNSK